MAGYKVKTDYTFTIEKGTTWGTLIGTAPIGLPCEDMVFTQEANKHRLNRAWGYRGQHEANTWQDTFGVIPNASVTTIMTPQLMSVMLPGILQKTPAYTAAVNVWTMQTHNYADLPTPKANNSGYFYTLVRNSPVSADDEIIASALPSSVTLKIGPTDNEGVLMADWEFIGKTYTKGQTAAGTIAHAQLDNMFKWGNLVNVSFGAYTFTSDFVSAEVTITNNAKLVSDIPDGEVVFPKWEVTTKLKVIANASTEALKTKVLSNPVNSAEVLKIAFGQASVPAANGDLIFTSFAYATEWTSDYEEGEVIEFTFEGVFGDTVANEYPAQFKFFYS